MGLEKFWSKHFKIPEQQVLEWKEMASLQKESLILWVLKNKKIDPQIYYQWAFEKYKIPRLKISFFQKNKINKELLGRYNNWPDHVFPIKEDANKIFYLACLEPVSSFKLSQKIQWILAPLEGILAWKTEKIPLTNPSSNISDSSQDLLQDSSDSESEDLDNLYSKADAKKGLDQINFSELKTSQQKPLEPQKPTTIAPQPNMQKSHKPITTAPQPNMQKSHKPITTAPQPNIQKPHKPITTASQPNMQKPHKPITTASQHTTVSASQPSQPLTSAQPKQSQQPTASVSQSKLHVLPAEPKPSPTSSKQSQRITQNNIKQGNKEVDAYKEILQSLNKFFDKSMILLLKNTVLRPWKWDSTWTQQTSTQNMILLNKPSIFQIVYKTKQKYHGYVVANDINDAFFQRWNQGQYPEHITILPLITKKTLRGMLLGVTSKQTGDTLSLDRLDILALEASQKIKTVA